MSLKIYQGKKSSSLSALLGSLKGKKVVLIEVDDTLLQVLICLEHKAYEKTGIQAMVLHSALDRAGLHTKFHDAMQESFTPDIYLDPEMTTYPGVADILGELCGSEEHFYPLLITQNPREMPRRKDDPCRKYHPEEYEPTKLARLAECIPGFDKMFIVFTREIHLLIRAMEKADLFISAMIHDDPTELKKVIDACDNPHFIPILPRRRHNDEKSMVDPSEVPFGIRRIDELPEAIAILKNSDPSALGIHARPKRDRNLHLAAKRKRLPTTRKNSAPTC